MKKRFFYHERHEAHEKEKREVIVNKNIYYFRDFSAFRGE